ADPARAHLGEAQSALADVGPDGAAAAVQPDPTVRDRTVLRAAGGARRRGVRALPARPGEATRRARRAVDRLVREARPARQRIRSASRSRCQSPWPSRYSDA